MKIAKCALIQVLYAAEVADGGLLYAAEVANEGLLYATEVANGGCMYYLMKYEVRKQLFSKIIIFLLLVLLELFLLFGIMLKNHDLITISNGILKVIAITGMLYFILEPAIAYEKDLGQKQGYLLFMTPRSYTSMIGAKLLTVALVLTLMFSLIVGVITMNDYLLSGIYGYDMNQLDEVFNAFDDVGFSFSEYLATLLVLLFICMDIITVAFVSTSISYSYFSKGKRNTVLGFFLFFVIIIIETLVAGTSLTSIFSGSGIAKIDFVIVTGLCFLIPAIINFAGTIVILDKKVSL